MIKSGQNSIDKNILLRLQRGEEKAFDAVYWKYSAWVYNFVFSLLYDKSLAEDMTQNVFLKIWERHALPPARREIYLLSRVQNLSNKEIAAQLSISERTVETQLYRSLRFLKSRLSKDSGLLLMLISFYIGK